MSDNAPSLPQTTDAGGAVSTAVSNKAVLELTEDEKSALENMSGMDKAVLLMLSLSEEDAAQIFKPRTKTGSKVRYKNVRNVCFLSRSGKCST